MAYSNVIAVVTGADDDRRTLNAAAGLIEGETGIVRVLVALPTAAATIWASTFGGAHFAGEAVQALAELNARTHARCEALCADIAAQHGLAMGPGAGGGRIEVVAPGETAWLALGREAPMADVVVLGESVIRAEGFWSGVAAEALIFARTPILYVRGQSPLRGEVVAIAWDGSLPAGRAVRAAMPLLKAARRVVIVQDPRGLSENEREAASPQKLKEELQRRGVKDVDVVIASGGREGPRLLQAARTAGASLIVSGAYGHSRFGEALFGGATRAFVTAEADVHLFMAH